MRVEKPSLPSDKPEKKSHFVAETSCETMTPATSNTGIPDSNTSIDRRVPLKTILQNFLNHVESLEIRKKEGEDAYEKEFQSLKLFSDQLKCQADFSCSEGEKDVNRKKNRYKDILPFDYTRVALSEYPGVPGSDYINANFIKGASGSNAYIACQGPLPHTVNEFWRMVVECEVQVIVMACNEQEAGKHKCEKYWNDEADELSTEDIGSTSNQPSVTFGKYEVTLLKSREICPDFLVRTMRLRWKNEGSHSENKSKSRRKHTDQNSDALSVSSHSYAQGQLNDHDTHDEAITSEDSTSSGEYDEERTVCQFHYSAWPDHGIPLHVKPLLEMVRLIRDCQASETLPVLIHCSAGCGRTGTICAIDFIWGLLRTGKLSEDFSLYSLVREMRKQRIAMVQTVDQYILVHRAVKELFLEQLKVIDAHPYENVDDDGHPISINKSSDCNEPVIPDYETIFVKNNENKIASSASSTTSTSNLSTAVDFDRILNQKMLQSQLQKQQQDNAYNCGERIPYGHIPEELPPNPPPKQRNILDSKTIDSKNVSVPMSSSGHEDNSTHPPQELVLFEPPSSKKTLENQNSLSCSVGSGTTGPQKFKKGDLRLTQTADGAWKLQDIESELSDMNIAEVKNSPLQISAQDQNKKEVKTNDSISLLKKGKHRKDKKTSPNKTLDDSDSPKAGELLRRPSIKKIKAFFNKEKPQLPPESSKDTSPSTSTSSSTSGLNQGINTTEDLIPNNNGDHDIALAISKIPKVEESSHSFQYQSIISASNMSNSKSVPNSLDRRACNAAAEKKMIHDRKIVSKNNDSDVKFARSQSNERIPTSLEIKSVPTSTYNSFPSSHIPNSNTDKPQLPVKRSKSMRAGSMSPPSLIPISTESGSALANIDDPSSIRQPFDRSSDYKNSNDNFPGNSKGINDDAKEYITNARGTGASLTCDRTSKNSIMTKTKQYFGLPLKTTSYENDKHFSFSMEPPKSNQEYSSPPPKPKRWNNNGSSPEYANLSLSKVRCDMPDDQVSLDNSSKDPSKSYSMTDFNHLKNQLVKISDNSYGSNEDSLFLESNLMKLQARKDLSDQGLSTKDNKQTLKDCQDYLMASFDMAEKEGERLVTTSRNSIEDHNNSSVPKISPSRTLSSGKIRTNRSAESSPITTMQKKTVLQQREQLFSSHSSPSSSYNKYNALCSPSNNVSSTDESPPYVMRKSGSNSSFSGNRKYHGQISSTTFEKTDTRNLSKKSGSTKGNGVMMHRKPSNMTDIKHSQYDNTETSTSIKSQETGYSNVALEAQRKVSAAVVGGGPKARERRNSFREAVESGASTENKNETSKHKKPPKKPYESIWFGKGGEECLEVETEPQIPANSNNQPTFVLDEKKHSNLNSMDSTSRPPIYVNTPLPTSKQHETAQRHYSNISYTPHEPSATSVQVSSSGYEPVTFHDGKAISVNALPEERGYSSERSLPPGGLQCVSLVTEIMNSNRSNASSKLVTSANASSSNLSPVLRDTNSFSSTYEKDNNNKKDLRKQDSSGSVVSVSSGNSGNGSKGPPPPYKQPPKVISMAPPTLQGNSVVGLPHKDHGIQANGPAPRYQNVHVTAKSFVQKNLSPSDGSFPIGEPGNKTGTYANVSFSSQKSAMDIPPTTNTTANKPDSARQVPPSLKHPSSSTGDLLPGIDLDAVALMMQGGKEQLSTSMSSLGGYAGGKGASSGNNRVTVGRTIAGVFSGAAANIKSRFSNISAGNNVLHTNLYSPEKSSGIISSSSNDLASQQNGNIQRPGSNEYSYSSNETFPNIEAPYPQTQYYPQNNHRYSEHAIGNFSDNRSVEQLAPNALPITVPGADQHVSPGNNMASSTFSSTCYVPKSISTFSQEVSQSSSHAYGYPQRPNARPQGPRNPPSHFQRKQEYL